MIFEKVSVGLEHGKCLLWGPLYCSIFCKSGNNAASQSSEAIPLLLSLPMSQVYLWPHVLMSLQNIGSWMFMLRVKTISGPGARSPLTKFMKKKTIVEKDSESSDIKARVSGLTHSVPCKFAKWPMAIGLHRISASCGNIKPIIIVIHRNIFLLHNFHFMLIKHQPQKSANWELEVEVRSQRSSYGGLVTITVEDYFE